MKGAIAIRSRARCWDGPFYLMCCLGVLTLTVLQWKAVAAEADSFTIKSWRTIDGLPQNTVNAIAQTPDGYLWLGTRGGLARFDGVRFVHYGLAEGLKGAAIQALVEDGLGGLWIGTAGGGLSRLNHGEICTLTTADGLAHNEVTALARDGADGLWVGSRGGLQHWGPNGFNRVGEKEGVNGLVQGLAVTPDEGLWFSLAEAGLFNFRDGQCKFVGAEFKTRTLFPSSFLVDHEGALWIGMGNGIVVRRKEGKWAEFNQSHGVPFSYIYCMAEGPGGEIWAGSHEAGLYVFEDGRFRPAPGTDASIRSLMTSRDGLLWVGTQGAGLSRLTKASVASYPVGDEPNRGQVNGMTEDPAGHFWVNRFGVGAFHGPLDRLEPVKGEKDAVNFRFLRGALRMRDGTVYLAGARKLLMKPPGTDQLRALSIDDNLHALCEGTDGALWLGTRNGELKRLVDGVPQAVPNGQYGTAVLAIERGPGSSLWLATRGDGLYRWDAGQVQHWTTKDGLPTDLLLALHQDGEGTLWIGTSGGGLAWLEKGRFHAVDAHQGLGDDVITQIVEDDAGNLWLGSLHGILRLSKRELREVAEGRSLVVHPLVLDESDGMAAAECTGEYSPAGWRSQSGLLCFSTLRGIVTVDPAKVAVLDPPLKVLIEEVKIDGRTVARPGKSLSLPPGTHELEIHYTAFNFAKPSQVRFQHRLRRENQGWVNAEGGRTVRYSHLAPDEYAFEVTAANLDGRWQTEASMLAITVQPFFWQTTWFQVATGLLLVSLGGGVVRLRSLEKRRREVEEMERLRHETTERQRADEKFRLALEASPNGVVLMDQESRIVLINAQAEKIFGCSRTELTGQPVDILLPERFRAAHPALRASFLAAPVARTMGAGRELFARRKDGGEFPVEIGLSPFQTNDGMLVLAVIVDITERKQAEHELALQRNELAHLSRVSVLGKLAGTIAHELNQPLAAMLSNSQVGQRMIQAGPPDLTEMADILEDITADAKRAGGIIHGMRAMFKKEPIQEPQPLDLNMKLNQVLGLLHSEIVARKAKVDLNITEVLPKVMAGRVEIQQVLINLIMNALDATQANAPGNARITITTGQQASRVFVSVHDNGPGISDEMLPRLFEPFATSKPSGLGLGLSISEGLVKQFGGTLQGGNHPDGGAVFRLELPAIVALRAGTSRR